MRRDDKTPAGLHLAIAMAVAAVFIADLSTPLGLAIWVFYMAPVALTAFSWRPSLPIVAAATCSLLLAVGFFFSPGRGTSVAFFAPYNRTFGFVTTWALAGIVRRFVIKKLEVDREDWMKAAQTGLSASMAGELTLDELGDRILKFVAKYTGADVGAIYLADGEGLFRRCGSYALDPSATTPDVVRPGDGVIGRVVSENELAVLTDVPAKYIDVRSSLGAHRPRNLIVAPAAADGQVLGALELGFLSPVMEETTLFARISESIATAVRSANYRRRQRELLEETQQQAEELQAQQEELRVQNEELELQSDALQKSHTQLDNHRAELEGINANLSQQAQLLEEQRDAVVRAKRDADRASTYKSEFLANMSHELRTPLNSSLILAKLLMDNRDGNLSAEQVKFAQTIYSAGNDLLTLINDILDLSKIEAGKLDVRPETLSVPSFIESTTNVLAPIAAEKGLAFDVRIAADAPTTMRSDPMRLQQILKNLLSNALKFTEKGRVSLEVKPSGQGMIAFEVTDTGIGIRPEQHDVIFEAFRQADGTTNRKYGGTGLGLSISRDLAQLLGGNITVDSALGKGSTFTLVLPIEHAVEATPAERLAQRRASAKDVQTSAQAPSRPPSIAPNVHGDDRDKMTPDSRSILVIEDDATFARILLDLARELDFKALVADRAEDGLVLAERFQPSAIVLDVGLPDRSGLSVLDTLKHNPKTRHIPVHMISALDYSRVALEMGAVGYAIKPVKREELATALQRLEAKLTRNSRRVLVVEDDAVARESTCHLLAADNVATVAVGTAAEALEQLHEATFDCMVLDLSLPDKTGFELLEEMSRAEQYGFPPVIVYTGRSLSRDEELALQQVSRSIIIKGARSPERLLDEVTLFLHQVESELPADRQRMLQAARDRNSVFEGRRVLVVEDDVRNVFALTSVLEPRGAKVEIARNGREALVHLKNRPGVDLVLMDIMMPEMDGLQATRAIRAQPEHAKLPIIALTAKAMSDDRDNCLAAGANDYIAKPLDIDKLLSLARVWMPKR